MNTRVDHSALRVNQALIILLLLLGFVLNQPWLVFFVAAVMLVGTLWPRAGLFKLFYAKVLAPLGVVKPHLVADEPQPHLFAQGLGGLMLAGSCVAFVLGLPVVAWILVGVVVVLAAVNLFLGFCMGCFLFYQAARRGLRLELPQWQPARR